MKTTWSVVSALCFGICALCSPSGFSCPIKSRSSQASDVSRGPNPRKWRARNVWARAGLDRSTPSGSGNLDGVSSVGGGHKNRALAHGYSSSTPYRGWEKRALNGSSAAAYGPPILMVDEYAPSAVECLFHHEQLGSGSFEHNHRVVRI